jgi:hypothetical protein
MKPGPHPQGLPSLEQATSWLTWRMGRQRHTSPWARGIIVALAIFSSTQSNAPVFSSLALTNVPELPWNLNNHCPILSGSFYFSQKELKIKMPFRCPCIQEVFTVQGHNWTGWYTRLSQMEIFDRKQWVERWQMCLQDCREESSSKVRAISVPAKPEQTWQKLVVITLWEFINSND